MFFLEKRRKNLKRNESRWMNFVGRHLPTTEPLFSSRKSKAKPFLRFHHFGIENSWNLNHYFDKQVCPSASPCVDHEKLTSSNQQRLLINVVVYASVMKKITLGSCPDLCGPVGHPRGIRRVHPKVGQMKKVTNKSCQVCLSDEKYHLEITPSPPPPGPGGPRGQT